jgi:hypothetical protein
VVYALFMTFCCPSNLASIVNQSVNKFVKENCQSNYHQSTSQLTEAEKVKVAEREQKNVGLHDSEDLLTHQLPARANALPQR